MTLIKKANNNYPVFQNWLDDFFGAIDNSSNSRSSKSEPAVNIAESDDDFKISFAVPGLSKSDFSISLNNGELIVKSEKGQDDTEVSTNFTRKEFDYSSFERSFTLPDSVDGESIKAEYKDGILIVGIPKKEEAKVKPAREIEIV